MNSVFFFFILIEYTSNLNINRYKNYILVLHFIIINRNDFCNYKFLITYKEFILSVYKQLDVQYQYVF